MGYPSIREQTLEPIRNVPLLALTDALAQNEFTASVKLEVAVGQNLKHRRAYITKILLATGKAGTGTVRTPALTLYFFHTDPAITLADTDLTDTQRSYIVGKIVIFAGNWHTDANGADLIVRDLEALSLNGDADLWMAVKSTDATTIVGDGTNGESLTLLDLTVEFVS